MTLKNIFYTAILTIGLSGCGKEFLQKGDPNNIPQELFFKDEKEATFGLYGIYDALQSKDLFGQFFPLLDEISDNGTNSTSTNGFREFEESTHSPISKRAAGFYQQFYNVINRANYVIQRTTDMQPAAISSAARSRIIAEASFLRDFSYFQLANLYRDVPLYTEPQNTFTQGKSATPKAEIYAFIKKDLLEIIDDLPVTIPAIEQPRAGRAAAIALLGKIYLFDSDFTNASSTLAQLRTSPYNFKLYPDYSQLFTPLPAAEFSSENIFQINFTADGIDNGEFFSVQIDTTQAPAKPRNYFTPTANLVDSYLCTDGKPIANSTVYGTKSPLYNATGTNRFANRDKRLRASILTSADVLPSGKKLWSFKSATDFAIKKYVEVTSTQYAAGPQNFYVIRYADVLLMYAEAENEVNGPTPSVYSAVNEVRRRAGVADYPANLTKVQMRQMIRDERRWEFAFESQRYFDLKRWDILKETIESSGVKNKKVTAPRDYVWPIPQAEIDNNPNIDQAPEWE